MTRALPLILAALAAPLCAQVAVDDSGAWHDPSASHHIQHAAGGAALGAVTWATSYALGADRPLRVGLTLGAVTLAATAFEVQQYRDHGALIDPVDIGWTVAGALVTTAIAELGLELVSIHTDRDSVSAEIAWSF